MSERVVVVATLQDELSAGLRRIQTEVKGTAAAVRSAGTTAATTAASGWSRAGQAVSTFGTRLDGAMKQTSKFSNAYDKALDERTSTRIDMAGAGLVAVFAGAVFAAAKFDQQMSQVQAVTNASAQEMDALRQSAMDAGAATMFSATDAARAQTELAKAGVSTSDILGGALMGSMDLAAAGGLDLARSAEVAANAMNMFKLQGDDVTMVADTLAAGANKSAADVDQLAQSLTMGGTVANQLGVSLQDTVGALSMFADYGIKGSDAGTMLKTMLLRLSQPEAAAAMQDLGINAFDAQGEFVGLTKLAGELNRELGDMTAQDQSAALAKMFGADAFRGAAIFMDEGAAGMSEYGDAVNDVGAASRMAGVMMDNLSGDVEELKGSLETLFIEGGSGAAAPLRFLTQGATSLVNALGALPTGVTSAGFAITGITGAMMLAVPRIMAFKDAMLEMGWASKGKGGMVAGALKGVGITAGVAALAALAVKGMEAKAAMDQASASIASISGSLAAPVQGVTTLTGAMTELAAAGEALEAAYAGDMSSPGGIFDAIGKGLGLVASMDIGSVIGKTITSGNPFTGLLEGGLRPISDQLNADRALVLDQQLKAKDTVRFLTQEMGLQAEQASELADQYVTTGHALDFTTMSAQDAASAIQRWADGTVTGQTALKGLATQLDETNTAQQQYAISVMNAGDFLTSQDALLGYKETLMSVKSAADANGRGLRMNTSAGLANRRALFGLAAAARNAYGELDATGQLQITNKKAYADSARAFFQQARGMGATASQAARLTKQAYGSVAAVKALGKARAFPRIEAKKDKLESTIAGAKKRIRQLDKEKANPKADAKTERLQRKVQQARARLKQLNGQSANPKVSARTEQLMGKLARAKGQLRRLEAKPTSPRVTAKIEQAQAKVRSIQSQLRKTDSQKTSPQIDVQNSQALSAIGAVRNALGALQDKTVTVTTVHKKVGGDTASSHARGPALGLATTLSRHHQIASNVGSGFRVTNMLVGGGGHGRGSGDHQSGRAVDVQGPRLGAYVQAVRAAGGFAELHGAGSNRHAHAVLGDTASPRRGDGGGGSDRVSIGPFYFTGVSDGDAAQMKRVVQAGIREYLDERSRRGV